MERLNMRLLQYLVFLLPFFPLPGNAETQPIETLYTLNGYYLGVHKGDQLLCFTVSDDNRWVACEQPSLTYIPSDVARVIVNTRRTALLRLGKIFFYDEKGRLLNHCTNTLPKDWPIDLTLNGAFSTECEIVAIDGKTMRIFNMDGQHVTPLSCPFEPGTKLYDFWVKSEVALVTQKNVSIRRLFREKGNVIACKEQPRKTFTPDETVDEMFIFSLNVIGIRKGDHVKFVSYDDESGKWIPGWKSIYSPGGKEEKRNLPDFQMP